MVKVYNSANEFVGDGLFGGMPIAAGGIGLDGIAGLIGK